MAENLDFWRFEGYSLPLIQIAEYTMFNDMFNFKKQRTLKESVGFFLFYAMLIMGFQGFAMMLGL